MSLVKCLTSLQWLEDIRPSWPNLSHLSLCDTVKTTDFDLKYIAECKDWSSSLRFVKEVTYIVGKFGDHIS